MRTLLLCALIMLWSHPAQANVPDISILVEAEGYMSSFYAGRPTLVPGNTTYATAIMTDHDPTQLQYRWEVDDIAYATNTQQIQFTVPEKNRTSIGVTVSTLGGIVVAQTKQQLDITDPTVLLYEDNPLRGLQQRAINDEYIFIGDETAIRAVPYFMSPTIFAENPLVTWLINNQDVTDAAESMHTLSLITGTQPRSNMVTYSIFNTNVFTQSADVRVPLTF